MPNRLLREGIITSDRVNSLGWAEEVFYRRLMSVVDDFGRFYGTPALIRAACYPLQLDKVSDSDIGKWLTACVDAALVRVYPASDGKRYLELLNFGQHVRAKKSKFPHPPDSSDAHAAQMHSTCVADAVQMQCIRSAHAPGDGDGDGGENAHAREVAQTEPTLAGKACLAMREAGLQRVSPSHPTLLALLSAGITVDELADAAKTAAERGKNFGWALAAAEGRRKDAAQVGQLPAKAKQKRVDPTVGWR